MVRRRNLLMLWVLGPLACGQAASGQVASRPAGPGRHLKIDRARRQVILDAAVSVRQDPLEFFLCTRGTKDYE
ncbi:hypothetical protein LCGC14_2865460, partial [marine sediment metagenome]